MTIPAIRRSFASPLAVAVFALAAAVAACGGRRTPDLRPETQVHYEQKLAWILRYEDQRILHDPETGSAPAAAPRPAARPAGNPRAMSAEVVFATTLPPPFGLDRMIADPDARIRRRSALAIGRVGLRGGVRLLLPPLASDAEPEVRQMAAFALGLLKDASAVAPLRAALHDPSPLVQGRAAEALASIGDAASPAPIAEMVAGQLKAGAVASIQADDVAARHEPPAEAFRLGVLALGRLKAYEALAGAVLGPSGEPQSWWWPVASAFQRTEDRRAAGPLAAFARAPGLYGRAFAARGLGALKDAAAIDVLAALASQWPNDTRTAIVAVRALGAIGDRKAGPALLDLLGTKGLDPLLHIEVVNALGAARVSAAQEPLQDLLTHRVAAIRAAAFRSLRAIDPEGFVMVLSGLDADRDWTVRAELASVMGTLGREVAAPRLTAMLKDEDARVLPAVIAALVKIKAPGVEKTLIGLLGHADVVVRAAAAAGIGELKPAGGERALADAFRAAARDTAYNARAATLDALLKYGAEAARPLLREALADKDWAVRVHAAEALAPLEPATDAQAAIRPAPTGRPAAFYESAELTGPEFSPQVYLDTEKGTIQIELAVLDAPLTCLNFMTLVRSGFLKGTEWHRVVPNFVVQDGDPRGDGEGGPGYTIRDEINERPYLRGTLGMALDWADTGGSQFFLTHSPQPHLDGRYTVFGHVVSGLEVIDRIEPHDKILRVRVWDGKTMAGQ
jgi:cyclophilin family peptidyl-prolyl cis-trans isomerase/HEAT repeat protein